MEEEKEEDMVEEEEEEDMVEEEESVLVTWTNAWRPVLPSSTYSRPVWPAVLRDATNK